MKTFKQFNESITDILKGKSEEEMINALEGLSNNEKIEKIIKYDIDVPDHIFSTRFKDELIDKIKGELIDWHYYDRYKPYRYDINKLHIPIPNDGSKKHKVANFNMIGVKIKIIFPLFKHPKDINKSYIMSYEDLSIGALIKILDKLLSNQPEEDGELY